MMDESLKHIPCGYCICAKCAVEECYDGGGCEIHDELKCPQYVGDAQSCKGFREAVNGADEK